MSDVAWALFASVVVVCITLGGLKDCDHKQEARLKCLEKGWVMSLREECIPPEKSGDGK